jgi:PAS domain S-box-containing protein
VPGEIDVGDPASPFADAAALGLPALAGILAGAQDGIAVFGGSRRYVYANPAACQLLGYSLDQLRDRDFLDSFPVRERVTMLARLAEEPSASSAGFTSVLLSADGTEREVVCSTFTIEAAGQPHGVAVFWDLTGPRAAARTAAALAQTVAQLVSSGTTDEILAGIARHAVRGSRALACGIDVVSDDHRLAFGGGYGPWGPDYGEQRAAGRRVLAGSTSEDVIAAMTAGLIVVGGVPGTPVVLPDARSIWSADPVTRAFAAATDGRLDWQAGVYVPLSWENRVIGLFGVYLPAGLAGPSEVELAFYTALADQAAVTVANARLTAQARQAAALLERSRLARDLHDSVSQALFSMTMHARAAQLALAKAGQDRTGPLGRSIVELGELTRGALAEMRTLLFELRPATLAEEGLVRALRKHGATLTAREGTEITVEGPEERLDLTTGTEEHLYRIVSEALHNVVKHARAGRAMVRITERPGTLEVTVSDDGTGFDPDAVPPGQLGLSTMAQRAEAVGAELTVASAPGTGTAVSLTLPRDRPDRRVAPDA